MGDITIGYNVKNIQTLVDTIEESKETIKGAMSNGWDSVITTMQANWVGTDEQSYEDQLAKRINGLYESCLTAIDGVITNIGEIGRTWTTFSAGNIIEGAQTFDTESNLRSKVESLIQSAKEKLRSAFSNKEVVQMRKVSIGDATSVGLKSAQAGDTIEKEIATYVSNVRSAIGDLYSSLEIKTAFLGEQQSSAISKYLTEIGKSIADLATCVKTMVQHLNTLTANIVSQEQKAATDVSGASTTIDQIDSERYGS